MKRCGILLLLCLAGTLVAADGDSNGESMPGLGPIVDLQPLLPRPTVEVVNDNERVLRELENTVSRLDRQIDSILSRYQGMRPATRLQQFPELEKARDKRDASWDELQKALTEDDIQQRDRDPLDTPGSKHGQESEERRLQAQNQLAVVSCLYELGTAPEPDLQAIEDGRTILTTIDYQELPIADRPFVHYYRFALTLQQARLSEGSARENLMVEARRHRDLLRREFPDSYLTGTADSLLANGDFDVSAIERAEPAELEKTVVPRP